MKFWTLVKSSRDVSETLDISQTHPSVVCDISHLVNSSPEVYEILDPRQIHPRFF